MVSRPVDIAPPEDNSQEQLQYSATTHVPLIKSPSLRLPGPVHLPPDIHPLPDDITAYFRYPFTLEPHVLTMESGRQATTASHASRREAYLKSREDAKEKKKRDALRRVAPGFEPSKGVLTPTTLHHSRGNSVAFSTSSGGGPPVPAPGVGGGANDAPPGFDSSAIDQLVNQLAAMDKSKS